MIWSDGYFTGLTYTHGYSRHLNPLMMRLACLSAGLEPPDADVQHYLELGYGQGLSVNIHAAANTGSYWGTDFHATHAAGAKALSAVSGAEVHLFDDAFREFAMRPDLPEFDAIGLHGIWSWISDENREVIIEFLRRKLKVGGVVFVSYNCLPGWAPLIPIRELMAQYARHAGSLADPRETVRRSIEFARDMLKVMPVYLADNPAAARHLDTLDEAEFGAGYIAHEYLNQDWNITSFANVAEEMGRAKLDFAASAQLLNNMDVFRISEDGMRALQTIGDPVLRESARDYMVNERFRTDVFIKGPRRMPSGAFEARWREERFVLITPLDDLPVEITVPTGAVSLDGTPPAIIADLLAAEDYRSKTIAELWHHPRLLHLRAEDVIRAVMVLVGSGHASPAQTPTEAAIARCGKLNRDAIRRALAEAGIGHLASPVIGGAISVPHLCLLYLEVVERGETSPANMAAYAWGVLERLGETIRKGDRHVASREEGVAHLAPLAVLFLDRVLPLLRALRVV